VAGAILEGLDEILTVVRLGLPKELRRSLACTNIIENIMAGAHRARAMGPVMIEAAKGFRRRGHPTKLASWGPPEGEAPTPEAAHRPPGTPAEA
jgi:hypothetical protein